MILGSHSLPQQEEKDSTKEDQSLLLWGWPWIRKLGFHQCIGGLLYNQRVFRIEESAPGDREETSPEVGEHGGATRRTFSQLSYFCVLVIT